MNGRDVLECIGRVSEEFVSEAELGFDEGAGVDAGGGMDAGAGANGGEITTEGDARKNGVLLKIVAAAACFALVFIASMLLKGGAPTPAGEIFPPSEGNGSYKLYFNGCDTPPPGDMSLKVDIEGYFYQALEEGQLKALVPGMASKFSLSGRANYSSEDGAATLLDAQMTASVSESAAADITVGRKKGIRDYSFGGTPKASEIEGIPMVAGVFVTHKNSRGERNYIYYADFQMDDVFYYVEMASHNKEAEGEFTALVADIISGGKADLSVLDNPNVPEIVNRSLTESEAYADDHFGRYLMSAPAGYAFESAGRTKNQDTDELRILWCRGYDDISIKICPSGDESASRLVSPEDAGLYDMSLYPTPWADSMPADKRHIIENPVFEVSSLTPEMLQRREYGNPDPGEAGNASVSGRGGSGSGGTVKMRFSVLVGDVVAEFSTSGMTAEELFGKIGFLRNLDGRAKE